MPVSFNLVDEPWLPVVWLDGTAGQVGLRDTLQRAHEIRELVDGSPLVTVSLHRLLLAILHRNFGPETFEAWKALWRHGRWDVETLDAYFKAWHHRFDLFDAERPFYQSAQMDDVRQIHPPARLAEERAQGNNATLFDHSFGARQVPMSCAEAARQIVARQAYAVAGGKSGTPFNFRDGSLSKGYVVLAIGGSLFETLALNLSEYGAGHPISPTHEDLPIWEQSSPALPNDSETWPRGPADYLTWQSRRIKLLAQADPLYVTGVKLTQNLRLAEGVIDPFKSFRAVPKSGWVPREFDGDRALWRDCHAILQQTNDSTRRLEILNWLEQAAQADADGEIRLGSAYDLMVAGLARDPTSVAKIEFWRRERFTVPLAYLHGDQRLLGKLESALGLAEEVGRLLRRGVTIIQIDGKPKNFPRPFQLLAQTMLSAGENRADPDRVKALIQHLAPERRFWVGLEVPFRTLLADLAGNDPEAAREAWAVVLQRTAWAAFREATSGLDRTARALEAIARSELELRRRLYDTLGNHLPQPKGATA